MFLLLRSTGDIRSFRFDLLDRSVTVSCYWSADQQCRAVSAAIVPSGSTTALDEPHA
ncbi:hypothetical protein ABZV91_06770 [Nocardia sp. NPDC004568]|uniref:hypothetical protein n=1 Tax=Nocardia sp. NPDC004568 TaxID=3154551 RepID=UPI0033A11E78